MPFFHRQFAFLLTGTVFNVVVAATMARAQDDDETDESPAAIPAEKLLRLRDEQQRQLRRTACKSQFDRWFHSQFGTRVGAHAQLELRLASRLRAIDSECHLTEAQFNKLELAGRGDIKHLMDTTDEIARTIEDPTSSSGDLSTAIREMYSLGTPVRERVFGEDSLFCKTLASVLDGDQVAQRKKALVKHNQLRHQTAVASAINTLRTNLALTEEQTKKLAELFSAETRPPRRFGDAPDIALVLFQASRIPEAKIRPILDEAQWRILSRWMNAYVVGARGRSSLENHGFVFDDKEPFPVVSQSRP